MNSLRFRTHLLILAFYLAAAVVITYPLITVFSTRLIGHPFGDAYEYVHHVWWIKTALLTGQNPFFMPNIAYPAGVSAALLWSLPLQSFPAWLFAFVLPLPAAFNLHVLITLALNGWAMWGLVRYLLMLPPLTSPLNPLSITWRGDLKVPQPAVFTPSLRSGEGAGGEVRGGEVLPALLAGLVFTLYPAFQGQLGAAHVGLLTLYPAPLFLYALLRLRDTDRPRRWIAIAAGLFVISLWGSLLLLIYLIAPILALYVASLIAARDGRALRRALVAAALGVILSLPFVVPLALDTLRAPPETGAVTYSASLLGVVSPSFYHPLFSAWDFNRRVLGVDPFEQASYVGVIAAALALLAAWKVRAARGWIALALAAWLFSLGPLLKIDGAPLAIRLDGYATHVPLPWALFQNLPLISSARTPARFNFAVGFAAAVLVGYGSAVLWTRIRSRRAAWVILAGLMLAVAFEYQFWWGMPTIPGEVPAKITALADRDDVRAVLDIPWQHPLVNKDGMFLQTGHEQPMIVGQVARRTPANPAEVNLLQATLDPALLDHAGVDVVILHKAYAGDPAFEQFARARLGDPFYEDDQVAAFDAPPYSGDPPGFMTYASGDSLYFYAPDAGSAVLRGNVSGERGAAVALDDAPMLTWTVRGTQQLQVTIPFAAGYHAVSVRPDPVCPAADDPALACAPLSVESLALTEQNP